MKTFTNVCRWIARVLGTVLVALATWIAIGEGMPILNLGALAFALNLIGILVGWRWELIGAIMSLCGWCLFLGVAAESPRGVTWFVFLLALPGILYLTSALLRRYQATHRPA